MRDIGIYFKEGAYECFGSRPKEAFGVDDAALIAGVLAAIGSTAYGAKKSSDAEEEAENEQKRGYASSKSQYFRRRYEDLADTAKGQRDITKVREIGDRNFKKAQGAAALGGGTDASVAQQKEANNKMVSDTMANLSAQSTARQDAASDKIAALDQNFANQMAADRRMHGQNIATAASNMGNAVASMGSALASTASTPKAAAPTGTATQSAATKAVGNSLESASTADNLTVKNQQYVNDLRQKELEELNKRPLKVNY